jgi:prepilin-type N-terminal cleavage/methylation domain-containing protein
MNTARGLRARLQHPWPRTAAGFTLIEVLIALLLVGAGLLAMSGLQSNLSRHTDLSRQRGEATLLAQAGMESLRHQSHLPTANLGLTAQEPQRNPLTSGSESIASDHFNTRYTRLWTVQGDAADALRPVTVELHWSDREGTDQQLRLHSALPATQPLHSAQAGLRAATTAPPWRAPQQRHATIPPTARHDGRGRSRLDIENRWRLVFDNTTGLVIEMCGTGASGSDLNLCHAIQALLLSGHLSRSTPDLPWPTGMDVSGLSGVAGHATCLLLLQPTGAGDSDGAQHYVCLLPLQAGQTQWQGKPRWRGLPTNDTLLVCRFEYAATGGADEPERNVQGPDGYGPVSRSLAQQNYRLHRAVGDALCPPDNPSTFRWAVHQDCRAGQAHAARDCP